MKTSTAVRVSRAELLAACEAAAPGLSKRDIVEQSASYAFRRGWVITYNDEVSVRARSPLPKDMTAVVAGERLLDVLREMDEEQVSVDARGESFVIAAKRKGKRRKSEIRMAAAVTMPFREVAPPGDWTPCPEGFAEGMSVVLTCAGKDDSKFKFTCVHVHTDWIEACDNFKMARFRLETGVTAPFLIRRDAAKHVAAMNPREYSEAEGWFHVKTGDGTVMSVRRYDEVYDDLSPYWKGKGTRVQLPKTLADAVSVAGLFSQENADDDLVTVYLRRGEVEVVGEGATGKGTGAVDCKYNGPEMAFRLDPETLTKVLEEHTEVQIGNGALRADAGPWSFQVCVQDAAEPKESGRDDPDA